MRVDRLNQLADALENGLPDTEFDMADWIEHRDCGTTACIAGHAALLADPDVRWPEVEGTAEAWLGVDRVQSMELFTPLPVDPWSKITASMAARVVRHLAKTGKVDWSVAHKEGDGE